LSLNMKRKVLFISFNNLYRSEFIEK